MSNKKKPKRLKVLEGTFRKDREQDVKPLIKCENCPKAPDFLSKEALAEWNRIAPDLHKVGLLTDLDIAAFAAYCQLYARFAEASKEIDATDDEEVKKNLSSIAHKAFTGCLQIAKEFGLTPSSRSKVNPTMAVKKEENPFAKFT